MSALLDWSYDLLTATEQRVLRACGVFLGGFTLPLAEAVCCPDQAQNALLEAVSALVDKSLVIVGTQLVDRRYRLLEPVRQYALEKLTSAGEAVAARRRHALAAASLAETIYSEWQSNPSAGWLLRAEAELSNLRAALDWTVRQQNNPQLGARIAAASTVIFVRLSLVSEGVEWCERVLQEQIALPKLVEARIRYGLSMLYNNLGDTDYVLPQALLASTLFREAADNWGVASALSQTAQHWFRTGNPAEAQRAALEAASIARRYGDQRLLATTLQRCANILSSHGADTARSYHAESVKIFSALGRNDETARALARWGSWETENGEFERALTPLLQAKPIAGPDLAVHLAIDIAACYLALNMRSRAGPIIREAIAAATDHLHPIGTPMLLVYVGAMVVKVQPSEAARFGGFAQAQLHKAGWSPVPPDKTIIDGLLATLREDVNEFDLIQLYAEGAAWSPQEALARAATVSQTFPVGEVT